MNERLLFVLTFGSALGAGVVAGAFFAFSTFVMKALDRIPPEQGARAMQSINVVAINPWFMTAIFGTGLTVAVCALAPLFGGGWGEPRTWLRLTGAGVYVVGCIGVTVAFNVPRNDALKAVDPASAAGLAEWARYVSPWTAWNTVRTVASLATAALFTAALVVD